MNKVLVVAAAEGFIIKGLETKLKGIGMEAVYSAPKVRELEERLQDSELIVLYTDGSVTDAADALVYIKDYCAEKNRQVMVIGTRIEYDKLCGVLPSELVSDFFQRPLEMEKFLDAVEKYINNISTLARRKSILIVDDDVSYMTMIMDWLKDTYRVSLANSGMQAITWLTQNQADLILLDYEMPVTTGPQVLQMIRSDVKMSLIPVMFLTGKGDRESILKVLALKPAGYLLKTISRKELRENIGNYFAARKAKG